MAKRRAGQAGPTGGIGGILNHSKGSLAEFMEGTKTLIENAAADSAVVATLAGFGYDALRLAEGYRLWEEAGAFSRKMTSDRAEKRGAAKDFEVAWTAANSAYIKTLKVARVAFGDDLRAIIALKLYGPRKQSTAGWLEQAHGFYAGLSSDKRFAQALAVGHGCSGYRDKHSCREMRLGKDS